MTSELSQVQKDKYCMISTYVINVKEVISNKQKQKGSARSQGRSDEGGILIIWSRWTGGTHFNHLLYYIRTTVGNNAYHNMAEREDFFMFLSQRVS